MGKSSAWLKTPRWLRPGMDSLGAFPLAALSMAASHALVLTVEAVLERWRRDWPPPRRRR